MAHKLLRLYEKPVQNETMDEIRKKILRNLKERWSDSSETYLIACFLNSRFKDFSICENVIPHILSFYLQGRANRDSREQKPATAIGDELSDNSDKAVDEIDVYLGMPPVERLHSHFDLLAWWKENSAFILICAVPKVYICRMPVTASIKGVFSMTGNILG